MGDLTIDFSTLESVPESVPESDWNGSHISNLDEVEDLREQIPLFLEEAKLCEASGHYSYALKIYIYIYDISPDYPHLFYHIGR